MSSINIMLPDSLHKAAIELAKRDHISISQFISTALAEKISALMTEDYLMKRAKNSPSQNEFEKLVACVKSPVGTVKAKVQVFFTGSGSANADAVVDGIFLYEGTLKDKYEK